MSTSLAPIEVFVELIKKLDTSNVQENKCELHI